MSKSPYQVISDRIKTVGNGAAKRNGRAKSSDFKLGYITSAMASYFKDKPEAFEEFITKFMHEKINVLD